MVAANASIVSMSCFILEEGLYQALKHLIPVKPGNREHVEYEEEHVDVLCQVEDGKGPAPSYESWIIS